MALPVRNTISSQALLITSAHKILSFCIATLQLPTHKHKYEEFLLKVRGTRLALAIAMLTAGLDRGKLKVAART